MFIEQPILQQLHTYWEAKRGNHPYPDRDDIDPLEMRFALGNLILMDVEYEPVRFRYRLFGSEIARRQGFDMTGKYLDRHPWAEMASLAHKAYLEVIRTGIPGQFRRLGLVGNQYLNHISLILPLGQDRVEMLLSGVIFSPAEPSRHTP